MRLIWLSMAFTVHSAQLRLEQSLLVPGIGSDSESVHGKKEANATINASAHQMNSGQDTFVPGAWFDYDPDALTAVVPILNATLNRNAETQEPPSVMKNTYGFEPAKLVRFESCVTGVRRPPCGAGSCMTYRPATCPRKISQVQCAGEGQIDIGSKESRAESHRSAYVLSQVARRFESTKQVLSETGLFGIVQVTPVDYRSHEVQNFTEWNDGAGGVQFERMKVYSNLLSFLHILEEVQKVYTCKGRDEWVYVFEDDIMITNTLDKRRIPEMIRSAEEDADRKGDALFYGGVCYRKPQRDCHFRKQDVALKDMDIVFGRRADAENRYMTMQCQGGCAHAWAVKSKRALEIRNLVVDVVRTTTHALFFDVFLGAYARARNGIITPAAGKCLMDEWHCGIWSQNRHKFKSTIDPLNHTI